MTKKYELTDEFIEYENKRLYRIRAITNFFNIKKGDLGGWIESEDNLSQIDTCWVYDNAKVLGNAKIVDGAKLHGNAIVKDNALISDFAELYGYSVVSNSAHVYGLAKIHDNVKVKDNAKVYAKAWLFDEVEISGNAMVGSYATLRGQTIVKDSAIIKYPISLFSEASIGENAIIEKSSDIIVFTLDFDKPNTSIFPNTVRTLTYTVSNKLWDFDSFKGTSNEFINYCKEINNKLYEKCKLLVNFVESFEKINEK